MNIQWIGVVGCGLMGHGIAQVMAQAGYRTIVFEPDAAARQRGLDRIRASVEKLASKQITKSRMTQPEADQLVTATMANLVPTEDSSALRECDLIVEAIVEDLDAKNALFRELGASCRSATVFASNTSSFPIAEMAKASGRPERFVGLHFFNPVQLMPLVEVVSTDATDPDVATAVTTFLSGIGKSPIVCRDTPGFVVNRLLVPYMVQAMLMLDRGDATAEAIDSAMHLGAGHPMGPITLADYVGLDTTLAILEGWVARHPDEPAFAIPGSLREHVAAGHLGRKTGRGYYTWEGDKRAEPATV